MVLSLGFSHSFPKSSTSASSPPLFQGTDMYFGKKLFNIYWSKDLVWIRVPVNGKGIVIKRTRPLFSERYGHEKFHKIGFGWRLGFLKAFDRKRLEFKPIVVGGTEKED